MKRLIIMRHAKSSWDSGASSDHQRPLNARGRADAPAMARALRERGWVPEQVFSSDSQRTRETWAGVAPTLGPDIPVQFTRELYHAGDSEIASFCEQLPEDVECALVLGHNPGWEDAVTAFTGVMTTMTTANCALLEADGSWADLFDGRSWTLIEVIRPRDGD